MNALFQVSVDPHAEVYFGAFCICCISLSKDDIFRPTKMSEFCHYSCYGRRGMLSKAWIQTFDLDMNSVGESCHGTLSRLLQWLEAACSNPKAANSCCVVTAQSSAPSPGQFAVWFSTGLGSGTIWLLACLLHCICYCMQPEGHCWCSWVSSVVQCLLRDIWWSTSTTFILFVISAPSDAADAANNRAEATDPAEHRAKLSRRSNTCLVGETEQAWQFCWS